MFPFVSGECLLRSGVMSTFGADGGSVREVTYGVLVVVAGVELVCCDVGNQFYWSG